MIGLEACAYHEAGHAVVCRVLGWHVGNISISTSGGDCQCDAEGEDKFVVSYAGHAAQVRFDPKSVEEQHRWGDLAKAVETAEKEGISDKRRWELEARARSLVAEHWQEIEREAKELLAKAGAVRR
jgi:hypothetical protein